MYLYFWRWAAQQQCVHAAGASRYVKTAVECNVCYFRDIWTQGRIKGSWGLSLHTYMKGRVSSGVQSDARVWSLGDFPSLISS